MIVRLFAQRLHCSACSCFWKCPQHYFGIIQTELTSMWTKIFTLQPLVPSVYELSFPYVSALSFCWARDDTGTESRVHRSPPNHWSLIVHVLQAAQCCRRLPAHPREHVSIMRGVWRRITLHPFVRQPRVLFCWSACFRVVAGEDSCISEYHLSPKAICLFVACHRRNVDSIFSYLWLDACYLISLVHATHVKRRRYPNVGTKTCIST